MRTDQIDGDNPEMEKDPSMKRPLVLVAMVAALWTAVATGCTDSQGGTAVTPAPGELRTDTEPIATRVPQLGDDFTVTWFGGVASDDRAPGPSTYWVEAIVTPAGGVSELVGDEELSPGTPQVGDALAAIIPDCAWVRSDAIDESWGLPEWETHVWMCLESDELVVTLLGGN